MSLEIEGYCLAAYILFPLNFIREQWFITIPPLRMSKKFLHLSPLATVLREARYSGEFSPTLIASVIAKMRCTARENRNPPCKSRARIQHTKRAPAKKMSRTLKVSRRRKPSREQGSGLPAGRGQPQAVVAVAAPAADHVHATPDHRECDAAPAGERFRTASPVIFQQILPRLLQVAEEHGGRECDRRDLLTGEQELLLLGEVLAVAVGDGHANAVDAGGQLDAAPVVLVIPRVIPHEVAADDGLAGAEILEGPRTDTNDHLAGGGIGQRIAADLTDAEDGHSIVAEGRTADRPRFHEALHLGSARITHGEPPFDVQTGIRQLVDAELELLLLETLEGNTHDALLSGARENQYCRWLRTCLGTRQALYARSMRRELVSYLNLDDALKEHLVIY